jgi:hypothetical protein
MQDVTRIETHLGTVMVVGVHTAEEAAAALEQALHIARFVAENPEVLLPMGGGSGELVEIGTDSPAAPADVDRAEQVVN